LPLALVRHTTARQDTTPGQGHTQLWPQRVRCGQPFLPRWAQ